MGRIRAAPIVRGRKDEEHGRKVLGMMTLVVNGLTRPGELMPAVQGLGRRHAGYGVEDQHYDTVGAALLWTLEQGLGESFTPAVREAWTAAYTVLANTMKETATVVA
jgi:hemoglobin-like flavoprotein